jgi:stage II sporulation protein E
VKGGKAGSIEASSIPAGILRGVSFEHIPLALDSGDTIIMVSDGVTASGSDWVKSELAAIREDDIQDLCEKLARAARANRADNHDDDITVLAAKLIARK